MACIAPPSPKIWRAFRQRVLKDESHLQDYVRCVVAERVVDRLDEKLEDGAIVFVIHEIAGGGSSSG